MSVCPHTGWETWPAGFRRGRQEKLADAQSQDQGVLGPALRHLGFAWKGRALGGGFPHLLPESPRSLQHPRLPSPPTILRTLRTSPCLPLPAFASTSSWSIQT